MLTKLAVILLLSFGLSACSILSTNKSKSKLKKPKISDLSFLDEATQKKSDLIYNFLQGELAINDENFDTATTSLEKASALVEGNSSVIASQLTRLYVEKSDLQKALVASTKVMAEQPEYEDILLHAGILDSLNMFKESAPYYRQCIKLEPQDVVPKLFLANALYSLGDLDGSISQVQKLVELQKETSLGYYYLGTLFESKGDLKTSLKYLKKAKSLEADNRKVELYYLYALIKSKDLKQAKIEVSNLKTQWADSSLLLVIKAIEGLLDQGDGNKAAEFLKSFLGNEAIDPHELRRHIGILEVEQRDYLSAIKNFRLVLAVHPEDSKSRYFLGTAYAAQGMKKQSVLELQKIKTGEPMFVEASTFASFLFRQLNQLDQAERSVRLAIDNTEGGDINLEFFLIDILRAALKFDDAQEIVELILEKEPNNEKALFMYGTILDEQDETEEALQIMQKLLNINQDHSQALNFIAYTLAEQGRDLDLAFELIQKALKNYSDDGFFLDTLGLIYFKSGKFTVAHETLERAVNLTGDDVVILEHYADVLNKIGKSEKAYRTYQTILTKLKHPKTQKEIKVKARCQVKSAEILAANQDKL
ncbi:MAG: tetratricopeptide repeat protein [bacterium]|nr:tetratricopeptide repeat protein [bacterium]